ncbi:hypothetical protein [Arthrobacter sp. YN]|uniref:hypothetical protein n=1 Tax=Arthrobacter sp. YN TaxID=2020486 RepID=UPI000B5E2DCC|nr:hypothetical protein [Arthrobacter sp. YN]ASN18320.1 hypothetical protein CGK93_00260 [Arthrobacter sp. YN]
MDVPHVLLPSGFARAWSHEIPGPVQPPGPQGAPVSGTVEHPRHDGLPVAAMLKAIWWSEDFHPNPATGLPGKVRKRPVPSAGGCYPVQLRVLCGEGCDVPPGTYVFNGSGGELLRLRNHDDGTPPQGGPRAPARGAVVVLTVLPQRTLAKYHHRAGPLLIADTAYAAVALVHHAAARGVDARWDVVAPVRWLGSVPEFALATVSLGVSPARWPQRRHDRIAGVSEAQLAARRSCEFSRLGARPAADAGRVVEDLLERSLLSFPQPAPSSCRARVLSAEWLRDPELADRCAGQHWIGNLDALLVFETPGTPTPAAMWWAATLAAHSLYTALGADLPLEFRPVGGWTGSHSGWTTLHGLGVAIRKPLTTNHERAAHAGQ